jgi:hypothetical protein
VIVTSRQSIQTNADLVQNFHNAWFATLKAQVEDFDTAASQIAAWGNNDWTFVYAETASDDFAAWLESVAQADLGDNSFVMRDTRPIISRLEIARRVWAASDVNIPNDNVEDLVNGGFVLRAADQASLQPNGKPVNDTFSISAQVDLSGVATDAAATLAVLPCRTFDFLPESTELTLESRRILDNCVVPTMSQSIGLLPAGARLLRLAGQQPALHRSRHSGSGRRTRSIGGGLPGVAGHRPGALHCGGRSAARRAARHG